MLFSILNLWLSYFVSLTALNSHKYVRVRNTKEMQNIATFTCHLMRRKLCNVLLKLCNHFSQLQHSCGI